MTRQAEKLQVVSSDAKWIVFILTWLVCSGVAIQLVAAQPQIHDPFAHQVVGWVAGFIFLVPPLAAMFWLTKDNDPDA